MCVVVATDDPMRAALIEAEALVPLEGEVDQLVRWRRTVQPTRKEHA